MINFNSNKCGGDKKDEVLKNQTANRSETERLRKKRRQYSKDSSQVVYNIQFSASFRCKIQQIVENTVMEPEPDPAFPPGAIS